MKNLCYRFMFIFGVIASCSDDSVRLNERALYGVWVDEDDSGDPDLISRMQYTFNEDGTTEWLRIEIVRATGEILGYRSRTNGRYELMDESLTFSNLESYHNDDTKSYYSALNDLIPDTSIVLSYSVKVALEDEGNVLVMNYGPCGPLANCISTTRLRLQ